MEANAGEYIKKYLHLKRFPRISLHCKLVPVQYWEYEYGLLGEFFTSFTKLYATIIHKQEAILKALAFLTGPYTDLYLILV